MKKILSIVFILALLMVTLFAMTGCKKKSNNDSNAAIDPDKILVGTELLNSVVEGQLDESGTYTQVTIPERQIDENPENQEENNLAWEVDAVPSGENGEEITQAKVSVDGIDYVQNELKKGNSRVLIQIGKTDYASIDEIVKSGFFEKKGANKDSSNKVEHGGTECTEFSIDIDDNSVKNKKGYWGAFERENVIFVYYYYAQNGIDNKIEDFFADVIMRISVY